MEYKIKELTRTEVKHRFIKIRYNVIDEFPPKNTQFTLKIGDESDSVSIDNLSRLWPHKRLNSKIIWQREADITISKESDDVFVLTQHISEKTDN